MAREVVVTFLTLVALVRGAPSTNLIGISDRQGAPGSWADCSRAAGVCIDTSVFTCSKTTLFNKCPGGNNIRCCPSSAGIQAGSCHSDGIGLCGRIGDCPRTTLRNKCPGPDGVRCCPTKKAPARAPRTPPTASPHKSTKFSSCAECERKYEYNPDGPKQLWDMKRYAALKFVADNAKDASEERTAREYPGQKCRDIECDAFRHALASMMLAHGLDRWRYAPIRKILGSSDFITKEITDFNERIGENEPAARCMDLHNNWVGRVLKKKKEHDGNIDTSVRLVKQAIREGLLFTSPQSLC